MIKARPPHEKRGLLFAASLRLVPVSLRLGKMLFFTGIVIVLESIFK